MKTKFRALILILVIACLMTAFSTTAFAYAENDESDLQLIPPETDTQVPDPVPTTGGSASTFTPSSNLTLVDDYDGTSKQFITVKTRDGNYYYIIIDRSGSVENVYFLDMVDEADLLKIMEEAGDELPAMCTCSDKCTAGDVNTACPVCKANMSECKGTAKPTSTEQPNQTNNAQNDDSVKKTAAMIGLVIVLGIGSVICCIKLKKGKDDGKGKTDLDNYDFGEDEDNEEYETETDDANNN